MKVVYLNYLYDITKSSVGGGVHVNELKVALESYGHVVKTYFLNVNNNNSKPVQKSIRNFLKKRLSYYLNQIHGVLANFRYFIKELRIINKERPDILLIRYNLLNISSVVVSKIKGVPSILEVNAPMAFESKYLARNVLQLPCITDFFEKLALLLSDRIIVVSQELKDFFINRGINEDKIFIVPNGVDINKFRPNASDEIVKARYKLTDKIIFGFVGSFHYWHGIDDLERFIRSIAVLDDKYAFLLVGDGPLRENLESRLKEEVFRDRVVFTGYISHDDIPEYLAAMDIVVAIYPRIKFFYFSPLKLFEYMASGKPIVATRIGQIENIIVDGMNGMLFEPGNMDEMIDKILLIVKNSKLRKALGEMSRKSVEENFTWRHTAKKISEIMENIVN